MSKKVTAVVDPLADFTSLPARKATYIEREGVTRAHFRTHSDAEPTAYVTRGVHSRTSAPVLMTVDGSQTSALPLAAIAAALAGGVITPVELVSIVGADALREALPVEVTA